jgi:hypothetical protein
VLARYFKKVEKSYVTIPRPLLFAPANPSTTTAQLKGATDSGPPHLLLLPNPFAMYTQLVMEEDKVACVRAQQDITDFDNEQVLSFAFCCSM